MASHILAFGRIAFLDTVRRPGFWISGLCFLAAGALTSIPFSPGIAADPRHYGEAGISTLLLGGVFISLMMVPLLLSPGRGRSLSEGMLALPLSRGAWVVGLFAGFGAALCLFFLMGGLVLMGVSACTPAGSMTLSSLGSVVWAWFFALLAAALALLTSRFFSYVPAVVAAVLILVLGYASIFMPAPLPIFFPAMGHLDPLFLRQCTTAESLLVLLHGVACIALYLYVACLRSGSRLMDS